MKLFSGSGNRVNNSRNARGSENGAASRQSRSSSYSGAVWEDEEPRVVKADGSATSPAYRPTPDAGYTSAAAYAQNPAYDDLYEDDEETAANRQVAYYTPEDSRKRQKKRKRKRRLITTSIILAALAGLYCLCVFSNIPFIAKWRNLYIETALMTRTHQWLATAFIPDFVIDKTRAEIDRNEAAQEGLVSNWDNAQDVSHTTLPSITKPSDDDAGSEDDPVDEVPFWEDPWSDFCLTYTEIDMDSFAAYAEEHGDEMYDADGNLFIDQAGLDQEGTSIKTIYGDQVLALDTVHGITLARLEGSSDTGPYQGVIAFVKDPSRVGVAVAKRLGVVGQKISGIAEDNDAVLAINASGFEDDGGVGNGGIVYGLLVAGGVKHEGSDGGNYKAVYFDYDNRLHVGSWKSTKDVRDGVEFKPALVVNGEQATFGSAGWGIHPRTAIGQAEDGSIIMIVIDGRQPGYSIGITVGELAEMCLKYGAVQALNLDGGSSSIMYYNGRKITQPSGGDRENGRYLPDAFVVYANRKATDGLERPE